MTTRQQAGLTFEVADGSVTTPRGFVADGVFAGIKEPAPDKLDLGILLAELPCTSAGVFTQNQLAAPPVRLCQQLLRSGQPRGVIVNSGVANACTGELGAANAQELAEIGARVAGLTGESLYACSTGVVGVQLPMDLIRAGADRLAPSPEGGHRFGRAIMTTDYRPKEYAVSLEIEGRTVAVGGAAKGAGMIHPGMATLLVFLTTDAAVERSPLQGLLRDIADRSFNAITVDGDTSTNDSMFLFANGASGVALGPGDHGWDRLARAVEQVATYLAKRVAREAEGATRLFEVRVTGAADRSAAKRFARAITSSTLVKSAVHGADPNWGRILVAVGNVGLPLRADRLQLSIGGVDVMRDGAPIVFDEPAASAALAADGAIVALDLGMGAAEAVAWGCDLSEEYVTFNSEYKT